MKVFVPQLLPAAAMRELGEIAEVSVFPHTDRVISEDELLAAVADADVLVALGQIPYGRNAIHAAARCRLIAAMHSRAGFVDIAYARSRGITVTGIENTVSDTTAEFTFALLMAAMWRIPAADHFLRAGKWHQNQAEAFISRRLAGKTLGIVGMGTVGRGVAMRARPLGVTMLYHKRTRLSIAEEREIGGEYAELDDLLSRSDAVVLNTSLNGSTRNLLNESRIGLMRPSTVLINTSRGEIVDEDALADALENGRLAGAALDVFRAEPPGAIQPGPSERLRHAPNTIFTPHIGTAAKETRREMAAQVVANIRAFHAGQPLSCVLGL